MRDEIIIRLLQDACKALEGVSFPARTPHLAPSYNALLIAAKGNHPHDPFLAALAPIEKDDDSQSDDEHEGRRRRHGSVEIGPEEIRILFGQLRIVLESYQEQRQ